MTDASDIELWDRIASGDPDAFGCLFDRHGPRIHAYALRRTADPQLAEDLVAAVFLEVWRRRADVALTQPSALPWLYGVASNVLRHQRRTLRRHRAALDRLDSLPPPSPVLVERQAEAAAAAAAVVDQVRRLPRRERDVVALSVFEGLPHAEVATALGISVGTVKSRLSRARARLDPDRTTPLPAHPPEHPPPIPPDTPPRRTASLTLKET